MSNFNDISCDKNDNKDECLRNDNIVKHLLEGLVLANGHLLDHVLKKSDILSIQKEGVWGHIAKTDVAGIRGKWTSYLPCNDSIVQGSAEKQRTMEVVHTLRCRLRHN